MKITYDERALTLEADATERAWLEERYVEAPDSFGSDDQAAAFFEPILANCELDWVRPEECGDLTAAPMLGVLGEPIPDSRASEVPAAYGFRTVGYWAGEEQVQPILLRWGWLRYEKEGLLDALRVAGRAVLVAAN